MKKILMLSLCAIVSILMPTDSFCQTHENVFDSLLMAQFPVDGPGAVAMVAKEGKVVYKKAFGLANMELNSPMKTDHLFRIGSNTKQFTAVAILKLAEEGKLSVHDPIEKYVKDYPTHGQVITIENLLTHTSGIKNYTGMGQFNDMKRKDLTPQQLVDFFKDEPMDFPAGSDFRYTNSGYILLGYIIEIVTGKTYAQYIKEALFRPLGMNNSHYDQPSAIMKNRAWGYKKGNSGYENSEYMSMTLPYAAGALLTTVDDLFTWYQALSNGKVLTRQSLEKAQTSYRLANGRLTGYGYGWEIGNVQGSPSIKHVGVVNGFITYAAYLPKEKIWATVFSNCECAGDLDIPVSQIMAIEMNKPYQFTSVKLPAHELEACQGIYKTPFDGQKVVSLQDGKLFYYSRGGLKTELVPMAKDQFYMKNTLRSLSFERNPKGKVTGFQLNSTGMPILASRTDEKIYSIKSIKVLPEKLEKYTGQYQFGNFVMEIVRDGDKLYGKVGEDKKELIALQPNKFCARELDATLIFTLNASGKVTGLTKIQSSEMTAQKKE